MNDGTISIWSWRVVQNWPTSSLYSTCLWNRHINLVFSSSKVGKLPGRCFECHHAACPPRSYRNLLFWNIRTLHRSTVAKHGSPPMSIEKHRRVPPRPGRPSTLGTGTTLCRRLSVLPEVVSIPDPLTSLMPSVVASELAPPESLSASVVVSGCARLFPNLVSVYGPNLFPPGLPGCRHCFDNGIEHCAHYPNPIPWQKRLMIPYRMWRGFAVWISRAANCSNYCLPQSFS